MYECTRSQIRTHVLDALAKTRGWILGIANNDTELTLTDIILIIGYISNFLELEKTIEWNDCPKNATVSDLVDFLDRVINPPKKP